MHRWNVTFEHDDGTSVVVSVDTLDAGSVLRHVRSALWTSTRINEVNSITIEREEELSIAIGRNWECFNCKGTWPITDSPTQVTPYKLCWNCANGER